MSTLHTKLWRDLRRLRAQVVTIAVVVAIGVAGFVGMFAVHDSLKTSRDAFYADNRLADLFAGIKRAPVLDDGRLVGVISRSDLLRIIAAARPEKIAEGDEALQISAIARLRDAGAIFAVQPEVTVVHGVVHLRGQVRSEAERDAARVAVECVAGIEGIEDHLVIIPLT